MRSTFLKRLALFLTFMALFSALTACGGSDDGSKEAADAIRKEAAQDGVNIDEVIANEQAEYERQHKEYLQKAATRDEALEQIVPDAEAITAVFETLSNSAGPDAIKTAEEYNSLLISYVEKWKDTDFKDLARQQIRSAASVFPDTVLNLFSALYDNVNVADYSSYCFYINRNDPDRVYVSVCNDGILNDYSMLKADGTFYTPDFSVMDAPPDHYVWFKGDTFYVTYLDYSNHPYVNWCFDLNGPAAGVGNTEEIEFDNMYEKGYWQDNLNKAFIEISSQYNYIHGLDIWS